MPAESTLAYSAAPGFFAEKAMPTLFPGSRAPAGLICLSRPRALATKCTPTWSSTRTVTRSCMSFLRLACRASLPCISSTLPVFLWTWLAM